MKIKELYYDDDLLNLISLGQSPAEFNEWRGDYIKIEVKDIEFDEILHIFYSNRLLLKYDNGDYYFGDYYFNGVNFMEGVEYTDEPHNILLPTTIGDSPNEPLNKNTLYQKQFNIYRDDDHKIYIKPDEVVGKVNLTENKYKLVLYFLRDIRVSINTMFSEYFLTNAEREIYDEAVAEAAAEAAEAAEAVKAEAEAEAAKADAETASAIEAAEAAEEVAAKAAIMEAEEWNIGDPGPPPYIGSHLGEKYVANDGQAWFWDDKFWKTTRF